MPERLTVLVSPDFNRKTMKKFQKFFIHVGIVTCAVVVCILFLNLTYRSEELQCVNDAGWLGLATKRPDFILLRKAQPTGEIEESNIETDQGTPMNCAVLFGKGWHNAEYR